MTMHHTYDAGSRRTRQTRTDGSYVDYGYDNIGQVKTAMGKESGGTTNRWHERMAYAYDAAGNLASEPTTCSCRHSTSTTRISSRLLRAVEPTRLWVRYDMGLGHQRD